MLYLVAGHLQEFFSFFHLQCWLSSSFSRLQFCISLFDFCDFRNLIEKVTCACGLFLHLPFLNIVNYSITTKYVITDSTMKKNCMFLMHYTQYKFLKIFWFISCGSNFFLFKNFQTTFIFDDLWKWKMILVWKIQSKETFGPCCINGPKNMTLFSKSVVLRKNSELQRFPWCLKQGSVLSEAISILILNISMWGKC